MWRHFMGEHHTLLDAANAMGRGDPRTDASLDFGGES